MIKEIVNQIRSMTDFVPDVAIVLGSGLGGLLDNMNKTLEIPYHQIENMPVSTAPSHEGKFVFGEICGKKAVVMCGRLHIYEGYSSKQVALPIRIMKLLGAKTLILTNAAGGINKSFNPGDLMLINDHIACFVDSPLIGKNINALGVRFPDMSNAYDKELCAAAKKVANELDIPIKSGVYCQLKGPQFETPAEIRMLSVAGADAVGMSTAIETIAAVHCGMRVCAVSLITNLACGILDKPLSSDEVQEAAQKAAPQFTKLIEGIIKEI